MKKSSISVLSLSLICAFATVPATAGTLYTNGPINGTFSGLTIDSGLSVSDSFTLAQASTVSGADFAVWLFSGDSLNTVDWSIGVTPFGASSGAGTASPTGVSDFVNEYGFSIDTESFSTPSLFLAAGTYWFTLQNASTSLGDQVFWDINNGSSVAYDSYLGNVNGYEEPGSNSDTFDINGTATPEPSSWLLLGTGLLGFARMMRRKVTA
ncbi:MAG: PEP-CTERM sorting domain-containing protein [Terracidiphilus sp.]